MSAGALPEGLTAAVAKRASRRPPLPIIVAIAIMTLVVLLAIVGPLIAPEDPTHLDLLTGLQGPSAAHPLGTDDLGRDILSRVIAGAPTALLGATGVALGSILLGSILGLLSGYRGGWVDTVIMRWVDLNFALPSLLVAIVIGGVLGGSYLSAIILLCVLSSPTDARLIRGATLEQRSLPYVEAARTLGFRPLRIMVREVWPNLRPIVLANGFLEFAGGLLALSTLSFLGIGVGPGTADWGRMLSESRSMLQENPFTALAPGLMIVLTATSMNLIGDWLSELAEERGRTR
jgi:peptide/nickel transport system permease protein